jgi:hypothetical protein
MRRSRNRIIALLGRARRHSDGLRDNCVTTGMSGSWLGGTDLKNDLAATQDPIVKNSDMRVRKRTQAPALVSHILVRRVRGDYPRQHLTTVESGNGSPRRLCVQHVPRKLRAQIGSLLITVSLERMKAREGCPFESRSE